MAEVCGGNVPWGRIFIGDCQSGGQRSWACVALQVDSCWCWAHVRVHGAALATTHAGDLMFIMEEVVEGKQVVCGHMKGGPVSKCGGRARAGEARCSPFVLRPRFWEDGVHEWETNDVRSRATYTEEVKRTTVASVGLHGLHTPMRCSRGTLKPFLHVWTQLLFWRGRSLMHVVCVCVCGTTGVFASLGLKLPFWRGRSDALRAMTFYRHKVVMDITFCCVVWGKI